MRMLPLQKNEKSFVLLLSTTCLLFLSFFFVHCHLRIVLDFFFLLSSAASKANDLIIRRKTIKNKAYKFEISKYELPLWLLLLLVVVLASMEMCHIRKIKASSALRMGSLFNQSNKQRLPACLKSAQFVNRDAVFSCHGVWNFNFFRFCFVSAQTHTHTHRLKQLAKANFWHHLS